MCVWLTTTQPLDEGNAILGRCVTNTPGRDETAEDAGEAAGEAGSSDGSSAGSSEGSSN